MLWLSLLARAHPPTDTRASTLSSDAWERVADHALQGPIGCFEAQVAVSWAHSSGGWSTEGSAESVFRFDHRRWRLDSWTIVSSDARSLEVRITPQLLGSSIEADLIYPMTRGRTFRWPAPIATLPSRLFGQVQSVVIDELADGGHRVREAFDWDGWKQVEGEIAVDISPKVVPTAIHIDATDRWPDGCKVRSVGDVTLIERGLPEIESWILSARCPLRDWDGRWDLQFSDWKPCAFSGPSEVPSL